jgi:hypothetical protein
MKNALSRLFNWKKNPASVFLFAIPLAVLGFGAMALRAILEWKLHGDPVYAGIVLAGLLLASLAATSLWRLRQTSLRLARIAPTQRR